MERMKSDQKKRDDERDKQISKLQKDLEAERNKPRPRERGGGGLFGKIGRIVDSVISLF